MKLRWGPSIIIFLSSYAPLAILLTIKDFNLESRYFAHPMFSFGILALAALSVLLLFIVIKSIKGGFHIKIERVGNCSNELINYTIPYIVSFLGINLGSIQDIIAFSVFMSLLCILTIKTQSLFVNPILAILGYGLYDVQFKENEILKNGIFLSRQDLIVGELYKIKKESKFLYIVTGTVKKEI